MTFWQSTSTACWNVSLPFPVAFCHLTHFDAHVIMQANNSHAHTRTHTLIDTHTHMQTKHALTNTHALAHTETWIPTHRGIAWPTCWQPWTLLLPIQRSASTPYKWVNYNTFFFKRLLDILYVNDLWPSGHASLCGMHWRVEQFGRKGSTFYIVTSRSSNETQAKQRT